ncbi:MAG: prolyl-tRNA synthetase associated domain-containing protein [Alphaproteobacteria bacterium]|nr:prolyl-tRNA synthetase associated domain-containing protein [Alphaproteobacteria bacterium]
MSVSPEQLFSYLDSLDINHETVSHPPIFTAEQGRDWHDKIPGTACKNLFLKDKKDQIWLVVISCDKRASLGDIEKHVGSARLSFGKPELLLDVLKVPAGSVTPFALMNDVERRTNVILDADLMKIEKINCHPLHNAASTCVSVKDLVRFIESLGFVPRVVDCGIAHR